MFDIAVKGQLILKCLVSSIRFFMEANQCWHVMDGINVLLEALGIVFFNVFSLFFK